MTERESKAIWTNSLLPFITACPQVFKLGTGIEVFTEDLRKAREKLAAFPPATFGAMKNLLSFIAICPQVIQPGIGAEAFIEELGKFALKFSEQAEKP